ncbi:hypothetical protein ACHAXS_006125 [Conticribra weissflogii]
MFDGKDPLNNILQLTIDVFLGTLIITFYQPVQAPRRGKYSTFYKIFFFCRMHLNVLILSCPFLLW